MVQVRQSLLNPTIEQDESRTWYFGFCENQNPLPWYQSIALRNHPAELTHCYAFTQLGQFVLFVEPSRSKVDFTIKYPTDYTEHCNADIMAIELTMHNHTIVRHTYKQEITGKKTFFNFIPSCVTVVKVATGYRSSALTPKRLFEDLVLDGGHLFLPLEE